MIIWMNGAYLDEEEAKISLSSEAFLFGAGAVETLRTYGGRWFRPNDHLNRLFASAQQLGFNPKWIWKEAEKQIEHILELCPWPESRLRIILSVSDLILMVEALEEKPKNWYEEGVKAVSFLGERALPLAKQLGDSLCYAAKQHAVREGAYESILINAQGQVREGAYSNLFWVKSGQLFTVEKNILKGITRQTIIEEVKNCLFQEISLPKLFKVEELFLTQTTSGILPIIEIDGLKIASGSPGPITQELIKTLAKQKLKQQQA